MTATVPERPTGLRVRLEVFPDDLDAFAGFYTRVLGFRVVEDRRATEWPYVAVERGGVRIGAVRAWREVDPAARAVPTGVEIVLEVEDVRAEHDAVVASGWPLAEDLRERPWGLTDFRVFDPAGHYLRVTGREAD